MRRIVNRDGEVAELYGETEDVPQVYVTMDRRAARRELRDAMQRTGASPEQAAHIVERVVAPDSTDRALAERERLAAGRSAASLQNTRELMQRINERRALARAKGIDDGMEASA